MGAAATGEIQSRDQVRAEQAFKDVSALQWKEPGPKDQGKPQAKAHMEAQVKRYATLVHKLPMLVHTAGLCQALHFLASRNDTQGAQEGAEKKGAATGAPSLYAQHLARQLGAVDSDIKDVDSMLARVRRASMVDYLWLTREALACAAWYRRMVQGVLKIDAAEADK